MHLGPTRSAYLRTTDDTCIPRRHVAQVLKTYQSTVPVNSAAMSPIYDHVLIGGGQEASQVRMSKWSRT